MIQNNKIDIDKIFEDLNFLKLKQISRMFLELPDSILEKFSEKYSSVLIYLLNILDHHTSSQLINKLTKNSIFYLIEEEIRLLLLGEFRSEGESFEELTTISFLLDELDYIQNPNSSKKIITEEIKNSIETLWKRKKRREFLIKFNYLYNFQKDQFYELLELIMKKKPIVIPILMIYTSDTVKQILLEFTIKNNPELLQLIPSDLFELKFYMYLKNDIQKVFDYLPEKIVKKLEYLEIVKRLGEGLDTIISNLNKTPLPVKIKREKILNEIYEVLLPETQEIQELIIIDLLNKKYITPQESELLQLVLKNNSKTFSLY